MRRRWRGHRTDTRATVAAAALSGCAGPGGWRPLGAMDSAAAERAAALKRSIMRELAREPFRAPRWLRGGNRQTMFGHVFRVEPRAGLRLRRVATPDGDFLRLHFLAGDRRAPTVLLLTGLEGSVQSHYINGLLNKVRALRWRAVVMEHRGCGGEMNRGRRFYNAGDWGDADHVARLLRRHRPATSLYVVGFSIGGNIVGKWLGEAGDDAPVDGASLVSPPFVLRESGRAIDAALGGFYSQRFLWTLKPKAAAKERQHPGSLDIGRIRRVRGLMEFDHHATAPLHGFRGVLDYYDRCGCAQYLGGARRPLLVIAAEDDPMTPGHTIPRATCDASPWLYPQVFPHGGHLGFVAGGSPLRPRFWAEEQSLRFFQLIEEQGGSNRQGGVAST